MTPLRLTPLRLQILQLLPLNSEVELRYGTCRMAGAFLASSFHSIDALLPLYDEMESPVNYRGIEACLNITVEKEDHNYEIYNQT